MMIDETDSGKDMFETRSKLRLDVHFLYICADFLLYFIFGIVPPGLAHGLEIRVETFSSSTSSV